MNNRETALKNAMMRTARFENIEIENHTQILSDISDSYYKIIIHRNNKASIIEILNKQIVSVLSAEVGEEYLIDENNSFILNLGDTLQTIIVSIEYYDNFNLDVSTNLSISEETKSTEKENIKEYFQDVHAQNIYAKKVDLKTVETNVLDCTTIQMGLWSISMENANVAVLMHS